MTLPNQSMKSWRSVNHLAPCILAISLLWSASAIATENFAGFRHIDTSGEPPEATRRPRLGTRPNGHGLHRQSFPRSFTLL